MTNNKKLEELKVKRHKIITRISGEECWDEISENENGNLVSFSDYEKLVSLYLAAQKEAEGLVAAHKKKCGRVR